MGMYSFFSWEDIKVTDSKGLVEFLLDIKDKGKDGYYEYMYEHFLSNLVDGEQYSFQDWNNIKLISYWYDEQVMFLSLISKYIEGVVSFEFETNEEKAEIYFKDGETTIRIGSMIYENHKPDELLRNKEKINKNNFFKTL